VVFQPVWDPDAAAPGHRGLLATDPRVRTLVKVLLSYPEVRYVLPDRISLEPTAGAPLLESLARFLDRQSWLVERVHIG
jgi:hypothetical protein